MPENHLYYLLWLCCKNQLFPLYFFAYHLETSQRLFLFSIKLMHVIGGVYFRLTVPYCFLSIVSNSINWGCLTSKASHCWPSFGILQVGATLRAQKNMPNSCYPFSVYNILQYYHANCFTYMHRFFKFKLATYGMIAL